MGPASAPTGVRSGAGSAPKEWKSGGVRAGPRRGARRGARHLRLAPILPRGVQGNRGGPAGLFSVSRASVNRPCGTGPKDAPFGRGYGVHPSLTFLAASRARSPTHRGASSCAGFSPRSPSSSRSAFGGSSDCDSPTRVPPSARATSSGPRWASSSACQRSGLHLGRRLLLADDLHHGWDLQDRWPVLTLIPVALIVGYGYSALRLRPAATAPPGRPICGHAHRRADSPERPHPPGARDRGAGRGDVAALLDAVLRGRDPAHHRRACRGIHEPTVSRRVPPLQPDRIFWVIVPNIAAYWLKHDAPYTTLVVTISCLARRLTLAACLAAALLVILLIHLAFYPWPSRR